MHCQIIKPPRLETEKVGSHYSRFMLDKYTDHQVFVGDDGKTRTVNMVTMFQRQLYKKVKKGLSPSIVIVGARGLGKSHLGVYLSWFHCYIYGKKYDFMKNTFYDSKEMIKNIDNYYDEPILIDEAGDILDAQEWWEKTHRAIKAMINTQRFRNNVYIFISPFLCDIDRSIRKHFDFQLTVTAHGRFKAFRYHKRYFEPDAKKAVYPIFLDDVGISLKDLPRGLFKRYDKYSVQEKKALMQKRSDDLQGHGKSMQYLRGLMKSEKYA
jgi:hypothetical protein